MTDTSAEGRAQAIAIIRASGSVNTKLVIPLLDRLDALEKDHEEIVEASLQWQAKSKAQRDRLDKLEALHEAVKNPTRQVDADRGYSLAVSEALAAIEEPKLHPSQETIAGHFREAERVADEEE